MNVFARFFDVFARFSKLSDMFGPIWIRSDLLGCVRTCWDATQQPHRLVRGGGGGGKNPR